MDVRADTPDDIAAMLTVQRQLGYPGGMLVVNPIPEAYSMDKKTIDKAIAQALLEASAQGVKGKDVTPFLLARIKELTGGESLASNIQLVLNNVRLAAQIAASCDV